MTINKNQKVEGEWTANKRYRVCCKKKIIRPMPSKGPNAFQRTWQYRLKKKWPQKGEKEQWLGGKEKWWFEEDLTLNMIDGDDEPAWAEEEKCCDQG